MIHGHPLYIIACVDSMLGIGKTNTLPWRLKKEIAFFKEQTMKTNDPEKQNMVIMGRKTYDSIPEKYRPLPGRVNVILTRDPSTCCADALTVSSLEQAYVLAGDHIETIYVIGGSGVFGEAITQPYLDGIYLTRLDRSFDCDVFFPPIPEGFAETLLSEEDEDGIHIRFMKYTNTQTHGSTH